MALCLTHLGRHTITDVCKRDERFAVYFVHGRGGTALIEKLVLSQLQKEFYFREYRIDNFVYMNLYLLCYYTTKYLSRFAGGST